MPSVMCDPIAQSRNTSQRAKAAVERMGSALLSSRTETCDFDINRFGFELRVVLQRVMTLDRVGMLDDELAWSELLEMDLERQMFHVEQLPSDRIWSADWVGLVRREFGSCGGKWFEDVLQYARASSLDMGAVDESLMGWAVRIGDGGLFELVEDVGSERKVGGVFYTPDSLVEFVLDQALAPAIDACLGGGEDVDRLLELRLCDPACGCGYFLVEAARRIAGRIAEVGGGDRSADVIRSCVVGGDINPLTAEICRWALWLAANDRSVTIDDLRKRVVCGDSLVDEGMFGGGGGGFDVVVGNPPFLNQLGSGTARSKDRVARLRELGLVGSATYTDEASAFFVLGLGLVGDFEEKRRPPPTSKTRPPPPPGRGRCKSSRSGSDGLEARPTRNGRGKCGRVCMVQPQSVVATRGGEWMRSKAAELGRLDSIWISNEHVFGDASVYTCAPCVVINEVPQRSQRAQSEECDEGYKLRRFSGAEYIEHEALRISQEEIGELATWSSIVAVTMGVPEVGIETLGVIGDVSVATADFRDEYYGLAGNIVDDAGGDEGGGVRLLTTGLVDLGRCWWGRKATRILKQRWDAPRVNRESMVDDARLKRWVEARGVEKVLVATQTKVVEALVDSEGAYAAVTPMISVMVNEEDTAYHPPTRRSSCGTQNHRRPDCTEDGESRHPENIDVWMVGAAIGSPVCSMYAMRHFGGAAMHADALKMSAKQVLRLPLPVDEDLWDEGAGAFERLHSVGTAREKTPSDLEDSATSPGSPGEEMKSGYAGAIVDFGEVMCGAYGVVGAERDELMGWWLKRLGIG